MKIKFLNQKKYKRFFSFGCSFTKYKWPTWADIIGQNIKYHENWAEGGAGNFFIFSSLIELINSHGLTNSDLIGIMWTSCGRTDIYSNKKWIHASQPTYEDRLGKFWTKKFGFDERSHLLRDITFIDSSIRILNTLPCDFFILNAMPIPRIDVEKSEQEIKNKKITKKEIIIMQDTNDLNSDFILDKDILKKFTKTLKILPTSALTLIQNKKNRIIKDQHPLPNEHLEYLNQVLPNNLTNECNLFADSYTQKILNAKKEITYNEIWPYSSVDRL